MIKLLYQGHSSFRLSDEENNTVIYIDPYAGEGYDVPADAILVTHEHADHNQVDIVMKKSDCKIYRGAEFAVKGCTASFSVGNIGISTFPAYNENHDKSQCTGFIVTAGDKVLYFAGDTSRISEMEQLKEKTLTMRSFLLTAITTWGRLKLWNAMISSVRSILCQFTSIRRIILI